jgi:eukaryotic-like serine/threonine-protein kinase
MPLVEGFRLGPYEIVAPLGAGGMGEVYLARDTRLERSVAVKVVPAAFSLDKDRLQRFEQEARCLGALNHPNLLAVYDVGSQDGVHYLVSELLEGENLRQRLGTGPLPLRKVVDTAVQLAKGLSAAHEKGIVHRDLKPDNVFITKDGRVKILDFGLAKQGVVDSVENAATMTAPGTQPGAVLGTVGYMSPEQVRGEAADRRSDIFSLGAILYELASGRRAFQGESSVETLNAIMKDDPPEISTTNKNIPPALDRMIRRCLEKAPDERFQSASDLAFAVEALSGSSSGVAAQATVGGSVVHRGWLRPLAATGIILGSVAVGAWLMRLREEATRGLGNVLFRQLSFQPEAIFNARFAPDGQTVLYSAAPDGNIPDLFVHRPDYPAQQSMGLHDVMLLSISSKGQVAILTHAEFVGQRLFRGTLSEISAGGGAPREVLQDVREADWSPDGTNLAIIRDVGGKDRLEYPVGKVLFETSGYLSDLRVSPQGDRVAFFEHPVKYDDRGSLEVVDLAGHISVLSDGYQAEEGLAWAPNGKSIFFSGQLGNGFNLIIYELSLSGKRTTVLAAPDDLWILDVSKDGKLLVSRSEYEDRVMAWAPGFKSEQDLSWLDDSNDGVLSSDGQALMFSDAGSSAGVNYSLCLRKPIESPVVVLGEGSAQALSPDDKWALSIVPTSPMRLTLYPTGAGEPRRLENGRIQSYDSASFFPDGKRVLACGNEAGQTTRCYVQEVTSGPPRAVTPPGTTNGLISPDENSILAQDTDGKFSIYSLAGKAIRAVPGLTTEDKVIRWNLDGRSLLVYRHAQVPARVERLDLSTGRRELVREIAPPSRAGVLNIPSIGFSADERSYTYTFDRLLCRLSSVTGLK